MSEGRYAGKTWKAFTECLKLGNEGKTFIFIHKNFVAIDKETWARLHQKKMPMIYFDEFGEIPEDAMAEVDKILPKKNPKW